MKKIYLLCSLLTLSFIVHAQRIDLSGQWRFAIDRQDEGITNQWFATTLQDQICLPGSMMTNNKGDEVTVHTQWIGDIVDQSYYESPAYAKYRQPDNIKFPFWLQPNKYYAGQAWYQRDIEIPESWKGREIMLFMERCHWNSRLWIDNQLIGHRSDLSAPQRYVFTAKPGRHVLTLAVDNRIKDFNPGINSHSISDHTQGNWNGVIGSIYLEAMPVIQIADMRVFPSLTNRKLKAEVTIRNTFAKAQKVNLSLSAGASATHLSQTIAPGNQSLTLTCELPADVKTWDEFSPNLYQSVLRIESKRGGTSTRQVTFGCRDWAVRDSILLLNGHPAMMRGTLDCAAYPLTGYPPVDKQSWLREFTIIKNHGLNHVRFHSWCPPEAAFEAADELGLYLSVECSSWANDGRYEPKDSTLSASLGYGRGIDRFIHDESENIVATYGNHPSFCFMSYGNEPGGKHYEKYLTDFLLHWKAKDPRRLYTSAAGWPNLPIADYHNDPNPRIQGWGQGLNSIINCKSPSTNYDWRDYTSQFPQPIISHEIGQWCVYPDFKEMKQYTGIYKPRNFEIFQETLAEHGLSHLADSFLMASGKLQTLCYKADIEAALRTPHFGGFQLLGLSDFPGQGTALVGTLNVFWGEKGYVTPAEYRRFYNYLVPLARMKKLVFNNNETFEANIEAANFGRALSTPKSSWRIKDAAGNLVSRGEFAATDLPLGNNIPIGQVKLPLNAFDKPCQLNLEVTIDGHSNDWNFWVYPAKNTETKAMNSVLVTSRLDAKALQQLNRGGSVLLSVRKGSLKDECGGNVAVGFSSIFWNTLWTNGQPPHTLGILCNPQHPALQSFPTNYFSDYQWQDAMSHATALNLTYLGLKSTPIVRIIDDWFTNRSLALLFEVRVGKGRLLISGVDLLTETDSRPEARQLLHSLKQYMASPAFQPVESMTVGEINAMFTDMPGK